MSCRMIHVITTIDDKDRALTIADSLVGKRLAACVQIEGPLKSVYRWKGVVEQAEEWRLVIKTRASLYRDVETFILENHPYELPEIVAVPLLTGEKKYLKWTGDNTI